MNILKFLVFPPFRYSFHRSAGEYKSCVCERQKMKGYVVIADVFSTLLSLSARLCHQVKIISFSWVLILTRQWWCYASVDRMINDQISACCGGFTVWLGRHVVLGRKPDHGLWSFLAKVHKNKTTTQTMYA